MSFPKLLAFNVTRDNPFRNDRFYVQRLKNKINGLQTFQINDAVGKLVGVVHLPHHKPFNELLDEFRAVAVSLETINKVAGMFNVK